MVALGGQRVRVSKPRLRRKGGGQGAEVAVPAYALMQDDESLRERMLSIVMRGVSGAQLPGGGPGAGETLRGIALGGE